jgi:hypothetical protein
MVTDSLTGDTSSPQAYTSRQHYRAKDPQTDFLSRFGATFLGVLAALIVWSCLLRLYVEWEWNSFTERTRKAYEQRIEKSGGKPAPVKGKL